MTGEGNISKRPEVKEKISNSKKGKPLKVNETSKTQEHKDNLSKSLKRYHENRRAQQ